MTFKKHTIIATALFMVMVLTTGAQDLASALNRYTANQKKVKTLVAQGFMKVEMAGGSNEAAKELSYPIKIYMKYPDFFKLILEGPARMEMVQKGDLITQKMPGSTAITTQKVNEKSDLFKKYFGYYLDSSAIDSSFVDKAVNVQEAGRTLVKYRIRISDAAKAEAKKTYGTSIDFTDLFFDENSLIAGSINYADGKELVRSAISYTLKDGIYTAKEIKTIMNSNGMKIISTIAYTSLSVNTPIADKEFEIK